MFVRRKSRGDKTYLQMVENSRRDGKVVQRVVATLGRLDVLMESGALDSILQSLGRFSQKFAVLGETKKQEIQPLSYRRVGAAMVFGRLWRELGIDRALAKLAKGRKFEFSLERAILASILQRLVNPGSDRAASRWLENYFVA